MNDHWWNGFANQGINDYVLALGEYQGQLIAGGQFTQAGGVPVSRIARWDGQAWWPLGAGLSRAGGTPSSTWVTALVDFDGDLIAGGRFTQAGDLPAANIARWDGSSWSAIGAGLDSTVFALTLYQGELIAGGLFTSSGGDPSVRQVARWDGSAWQPLGGDLPGNVRALYVSEEQLIVGGAYDPPFEASHPFVAWWNGFDWTVSTDLFGNYSAVLCFAEYHGELLAGGTDGIAEWVDTHWVNRGYGYVADLTLYNGDMVAGGPASDGYIVRMQNGRWESLGSGTDRRITALLVHENHLYVGGWFRNAGNKPSAHIARWDD